MADIVYGLTQEGFRRKRLPELLQGLNDRVADKLGLPIETSANSVFGQIHGVYAFALSEMWEELEKLYYSMFPSTAEGVSLANAAGLAGIAQIDSEPTNLIATCYGVEGAEVPYNAQIASSNSNIFYNREEGKTISANRASEITLKISTVEVDKNYYINLDGVSANYTATEADTATTIFTELTKDFEFSDRTFTNLNGVLKIAMNDSAETFALSTNLEVENIGSPFLFESVLRGAINPAIGTVTQIITNYSGWTGVSNNRAANVGRDNETDTELRQRWSRSVYARGLAMCESIAAAIYEQCEGVTVVKVYENTKDYTDLEGRPPHSIEAVVEGGEPQDICNVIFSKKSGGIDTFGTITRTCIDSQDIAHEINFNRPEEIQIWLKIEIDYTDKEEAEISSSPQSVRMAVLEKAAEFGVGDDIILQKFKGAIYENCAGIGYITVYAKSSSEAEWSKKNIKIDSRHFASFEESRIEVVEL